MQQYKLLVGDKAELEREVTDALNSGWELLDLTSTTIGSTIHFTQAMTRTAETSLIVEPATPIKKAKR